MEWGKAGKVDITSLSANRVLDLMAELTVGWLLLEGAAIAHEQLTQLSKGQPDYSFYEGKCHAALYFARNVLPAVANKVEILAREDRSALEIPEDAFATI